MSINENPIVNHGDENIKALSVWGILPQPNALRKQPRRRKMSIFKPFSHTLFDTKLRNETTKVSWNKERAVLAPRTTARWENVNKNGRLYK